jgi:4a-hydroxytetrahydrobiopterin dehydratase
MLNLLATPGLGSLMARRWIAGGGQLALAIVGFVLVVAWFVKIIGPYYDMMFSDSPQAPINWRIGGWGAALFALAWVWSLVTSISLFREAASANLQTLQNSAGPPMPKLDAAQIAIAMATLPQWKQTGDAISRAFQFRDFRAAMKFVNAVAIAAEQAWHHPDIDIRWNQVTLALTTHDAGGLTQKDFDLARQFDQLSLR